MLAIAALHRSCPFAVVHAIWSGACGEVAVTAARILGIPSVVHVAGGELVALREIGYGGRLNWRGRLREALVLRGATAVAAASAALIQAWRSSACRRSACRSASIWPAGHGAIRYRAMSAGRRG